MATHCQQGKKENVVAYIKSKGLAADTPNVTVSSFGGHPKIKGNGYVPYYMVFDHTGQLVRHHMCGAYHGGDGMKMVEVVEDLLKKVPDIYTGREPYTQVPDLAARIGGKKDLAGALAEIEERLDGREDPAQSELERLRDSVTMYRDRELAGARRALASTPDRTVPRLKALSKDLAGTSLVADVDKALEELDGSTDLKAAIKVQKSLAKARKTLDKLKPCKTCKRQGHKGRNSACAECNRQSRAALSTLAKRLDKLLGDNEHLPIAASVKSLKESLE
ncbi:MAG: hypothetical protein ACYTG4_16805 [Planctomycetota bacterium]